MSRTMATTCAVVSLLAGPNVRVRAADQGTGDSLPIVQLLAFKNGYSFITREGQMPLREGVVTIPQAPQAILGTYWGYSRDKNLVLRAVKAVSANIQSEQAVVTLPEILAANIGKTITVSEPDKISYTAIIKSVPTRKDKQPRIVAPPQYYDSTLQRYVMPPPYREIAETLIPSSVVVLQVQSGSVPVGTRIVPLNRVIDVTFVDPPETMMPVEQERTRIEMQLSGQDHEAAVGVACLQRGMRWIPEYALLLDANGAARLKMQATLINDLEDLEGVKARLAIGVPSFAFGDELSPIALADAFDRLSQYFQPSPAGRRSGMNFYGQAIMSQSSTLYAGSEWGSLPADASMERAADLTARIVGPKEDLFIYELPNITLKKGARLIVPVLEAELEYEDAYVWDIAAFPPTELLANINADQVRQLQALLETNRVRHTIEFSNDSTAPLTTGPVIVMRDGQLIAQSLLPYTSTTGTAEVDLTVATDIRATKTERETTRTPKDIQLNGHDYTKIELTGQLMLTNFKDKTARIRIRRFLLGAAEHASHEGHIENINTLEDFSALPAGSLAYWRWIWPFYNWNYWPNWWRGVNRMSRIDWDIQLAPGETTTLSYDYHYHVY